MVNKQRTHGLSVSVNIYQIISWAVFGYSFIIFCIFLIPASFNIPAIAIIAGLVYFGLTIVIVILGLIAILTDPTDSRVTYEHGWRRIGIEPEEDEDMIYFCDVWESFVHERTKHWGDWNRCCENFDHHCIWLNNWVGKKNYNIFIVLVTLLKIHTWISFIFSIQLILIALIDTGYYTQGFNNIYGANISPFIVIPFVIISNVFNILILIFTTTLLKFHYKLYKMGISTYEYIAYNREKKERKEWLKDGIMTKERYEEENERALEDIRIIK